MKSEFLRVADFVLSKHNTPMSPKEIIHWGQEDKLFSDKLSGKTPHQTLKSKLSVHIRTLGERSHFVRTAANRFYLRRLLAPPYEEWEATPLRRPPPTERVLGFPVEWLDTFGRFQGVNRPWKRFHSRLCASGRTTYIPRLEAEQRDDFKQVLTYILVTRGDRVLSYQRGTYNRVEAYLRGSLCVGFGGHVNEDDLSLYSDDPLGVRDNVVRELVEELELPPADVARLARGEGLDHVGLLNDDSSPVGRRHIAYLLRYEVSDDPYWDSPRRGEKSITQLEWLDPRGEFRLWEYEYWSQLCLVEFLGAGRHARAAYRIRRIQPLRAPSVLCVLGELGSGKSFVTAELCRRFGFFEVNSGEVLATLLGVPPVRKTGREKFQQLAQEFIERPDGPSLLGKAIADACRGAPGQRALVDGVRHRATLDEVRRRAGVDIGVIYVYTPPHVAYRFVCERLEQPIEIGEFTGLREAAVETDVRGLIADADAVLYNWRGRSHGVRAVEGLMREVMGGANG